MKKRETQLKALRGTKDILPQEAKLWTILEDKARDVFKLFGYEEIRTPIIEETPLFIRSLGEGTDIVEKQMYTFLDRGERSVALRPEATASAVRAYLEHGMDMSAGLVKLFYIGPMFRAERPQAGRARQFHQIGIEAIGSYSPFLDAETIALLSKILDSFGIKDFSIKLNSLGCEKDKKELSNRLRQLLEGRITNFCDDCNGRYEKNVLRILDCKNENCKDLLRTIFKGTGDCLCSGCRFHFGAVKEALAALKIGYELEPYLVRGLDYYTKTTFEVTHNKLGAQDAIAAGGRYDNLVSDLGGPEKGACGFAIGMERTIMAIEEPPRDNGAIDVYLATIGQAAYNMGFKLAMELRMNGISAELDYEDKSLKGQMRWADKLGARLVGIVGDDEIRDNTVTLRDMRSKEQRAVSQNNFITEVRKSLFK